MPSRDDVIRMAEALGVKEYGPMSRNWSFELSQLERFAQLVAAHEREECARMADEYATWGGSNFYDWFKKLGAAIRARGTA